MSRIIMTAIAAGVSLLVAGCGDSGGSGAGGGTGGGTLEDGSIDNDAAEGPWECLEGNVARRKSDGDTVGCGLLRCTVVDGCGNTALGCGTDEDCVSSTAEAGWDIDQPVKCVYGLCDYGP